MRDTFLRLLGGIDRCLRLIEQCVVGGCILAMALLMSAHVVGQALLGEGIPGTYEVTKMLILGITFVGLGYAARQARHIRMSAIYEQLNDPSRKVLQVLIAAGTAALMFFFAWKAGQYVIDIHDRGRASASLQIPLWTVYTVLPAGFALAGIQYLLTIARNLTTAGVWRSFTEKDVYAQVPEQGDQGEGGSPC